MMKKTLIPVLALAAVLLFVLPALCQDDITELQPAEFTNPERPAALFPHDAHNEKAELDDCVVCHHSGENGKINMEESSEGTPCAECHPVKAPSGTTDLMNAYHKQCILCHQDKGKGPQACGECHVKK